MDDEEQAHIIKRRMRMFTMKCDAIMREQGILIIRSKEGANRGGLMDKSLLEKLRVKARMIESEICRKLNGKGHTFQTRENTNDDFKYHEVASRGLRRLDIHYHLAIDTSGLLLTVY